MKNLFISLVLLVSLFSCDKAKEAYEDLRDQGLEEEPEVLEEVVVEESEPYYNLATGGKQKWDHIRTGTIYKPYSDRQPSRVVFLSGPEFQEVFRTVLIDGKACTFDKIGEWDSSQNDKEGIKQNAKDAGNFDYEKDAPLRQVWRCDFTCDKVSNGSQIVATDSRQSFIWDINNSCERH